MKVVLKSRADGAGVAIFALLIHANSNTMRRWLWQDMFNNVGVYESGNVVIHAVVSVILIYTVCTVIDICRIKLFEAPLMKKLK